MQLCLAHWDELKEAIRQRGLWPLVSESGQAAMNRIQEELAETATDDNFDPLLSANFAIWTRALQVGGLYLMFPGEDGSPLCPLCELEKNTETKAQNWIDGCADDIRAYCVKKGILPN